MLLALDILFSVINILVLYLESRRDAKQRKAGQDEILGQQKEANAKAAEHAAAVDAITDSSDIDDLRDRMRKYQRPSDAL